MKRTFSIVGRLLVAVLCIIHPAAAEDRDLVQPAGQVLVPAGADWKYEDSNERPRTDWAGLDFDDGAWSSGKAQLGYGDGDEATVTRRAFAVYFRKAVEVADVAGVTNLALRLLCDDGAVVYLNGRELTRVNMPDGPVDHLTAASHAADESKVHSMLLPAILLRPGRNVLAVEVHQVNIASSDISFDASMVALRPTDPPPPTVVSIKATRPETTESTPTARPIPAEFTLSLDRPSILPIKIFLRYGGTATPDKDYPALPAAVMIDPGETTHTLQVSGMGDDLAEGTESVICQIIIPPDVLHYRVGGSGDATVTILDSDETVVSISAIDATGREFPAAVDAFDAVAFKITRTGDVSRALGVFYSVGGTASPESDYRMETSPAIIPAGADSVILEAVPKPDDVEEGLEFIYVRLQPSLLLGPLPTYQLPETGFDALGIIHDDEVESRPTLAMVMPSDGAEFAPGHTIHLVAAAYSPALEILDINFYAGDRLIGSSSLDPKDPARGSPLYLHRFEWKEPPVGMHVLTARHEDANGAGIVSNPIHVRVGPSNPPIATVSIEATSPIAEETSAPLRRLPLVGVFKLSRTGSTENSLPVFLHIGGTATPGRDYAALPFLVTIPTGQSSMEVQVIPQLDEVAEPIETVIATLSHCPPHSDPPLGLPCYDFRIDPVNAHATVFVRDDGITSASVWIDAPRPGAEFEHGAPVDVVATAIDLEGAITRLELLASGAVVGTSELVFIREPDPGTPILHSFVWDNAPTGIHVLTARGMGAAGQSVVSQPVRIEVAGEKNKSPRVGIAEPKDGQTFPPATEVINIVAKTSDPDGFVSLMEFFIDGRRLGEVTQNFLVPPPPGETQTFTIAWPDPAPGGHVLVARATDNLGLSAESAPVTIRVAVEGALPVVVVLPHDPFAVEPGPVRPSNTASFRIRRYGSISNDLRVDYNTGGVAENGIDYERTSGTATIPAGKRSTLVTITPLADSLPEVLEPLSLHVIAQRDDGPERYRVGRRHSAWAIILDRPWRPFGPGNAHCTPLGGGLFHIGAAVPAESASSPPIAAAYRLEATEDFLTWTTIHTALSFDDALHFVDPEAANFPNRYYRVAPDDSVAGELEP
ncbi:MAG: Ig-like domain-containing protein [Verrucomicrobiales bacterium]